ncbi:MAG: DUF2330 domain-containing protein [Myxococcota bacterium]
MAPTETEACGGTFCDAGPAAMPVDQTGENILFVMGEGYTEAHIQIQYDPDAEADEFAWVVPLQDVPTFAVGSQPLFDRILAGTVPSYGFQTQFTGDGCGDTNGGSDGGGAATSAGGDSTGGGEDPGPEIVLQQIVGAFEITVLSGGTAQELVDWLDANGYQQDPNALPILEEYLSENYLFAAFKLTNDAEVADIHPVVLRFELEEACVPIRLTRIAAVEDMDIRTFFLADSRVVPQTYKHVLVNPLKLDWPTRASNYKQVITQAVDADQAVGKAFVTEYAGPSDVILQLGIVDEQWQSTVFQDLGPEAAIDTLKAQGLLDCFEFDFAVCDFRHPLLQGLMQQFLPPPEGVEEAEFYECPECYPDMIDLDAWDGLAFAALLEERIIAPGQHAVSLLDSFPTLTRMYTTISPGEMNADPFFHPNPDLPDVDRRSEIATRQIGCGADEIWILPDGREVYVPGGIWPDFSDEMPWEEEVQEIAAAGGPVTLSTLTAVIDEQLTIHNCQYNYPSAQACGNEPPDPTGGSGGSDSMGGTGGSDDPGQDGDGGSSGCGCSSDSPQGGGAALLLGLGLLGLGRSRRRRAG